MMVLQVGHPFGTVVLQAFAQQRIFISSLPNIARTRIRIWSSCYVRALIRVIADGVFGAS